MIYKKQELKGGSAAILAKASLGVRMSPASGAGGDRPLVLGQAVRYPPQEGCLMQGEQSRGERTGAGRDRFFVLLLLLDLFCLWSVKSCSGRCPPRLGCTYRKSWLPGLAAALFRRKSGLAWAAGARWLQVMRFSFLTFFLSFFFLFHFVEIFTAIGEEERGVRGPPRERSKPRTHSSGSPRPQICSPNSPAHRTGNCPNVATPVG